MKIVVLAGGYGTRLAEQTELKPKPMVEIGGYPMLWHILKHYAHYEHREFVIALGHRGDDIKRYFLERASLTGDLTVRLANQQVERRNATLDDWTVQLIETGAKTNTGGRVRRLRPIHTSKLALVDPGTGKAATRVRHQRNAQTGEMVRVARKSGHRFENPAKPPAKA